MAHWQLLVPVLAMLALRIHAFAPGALRTHRGRSGVALTRPGLAESRSLSHRTFGGEAGRGQEVARLGLRGGRARRGLARTSSEEEEWEESEPARGNTDYERQRLLISAVEETPHDAFALGELGEFLWEQMGDLDAAEDMFKRAVASNPHDVGALTDLAAFLCEERRQLDEAEQLYRRAVASAPSDSDALCCLADFLSHERSDLAGAAEQYNKAVLNNPSDTDALCDFAAFLVEQAKNTTAAEALLIQAIQCRPHAVDTLSAYAEFLRTQKKDLPGAGEYYRYFLASIHALLFRLLRRMPHPLCGDVYHGQDGRYALRRQVRQLTRYGDDRRSVESNPHDPDALCDLALWCTEASYVDEAEGLLTRVITLS